MKKILLVFAILFMAAMSTVVNAQMEIAWNCEFTGDSSDICFASDGSNNYIVYNCRPGSTSCGYFN
jgi:hypothetical protein